MREPDPPVVGLVVAKAPVPGEAKTRLAAHIGPEAAAEVAAAALFDTLDACERAFGREHCRLALAGDLAYAAQGELLLDRLEHWTVFPQRGFDFASRLASAHLALPRYGECQVVQVGMDTPQVTESDLLEVARLLRTYDTVVGPAVDGGWWALGLREPGLGGMLIDVPMSTDHTCADTEKVFRDVGARVVRTRTLHDFDTYEDAAVLAATAPGTWFARAWHTYGRRIS